jgi:gas vesicle protein
LRRPDRFFELAPRLTQCGGQVIVSASGLRLRKASQVDGNFWSDLLGTLIGALLGTAGAFLVADWQVRKSRRDTQLDEIRSLPSFLKDHRALDPTYDGRSEESGRSDVQAVTDSIQRIRARVRDVLGRVPDEVRAHSVLDDMLNACGRYLYKHDEHFTVPEAAEGSQEQMAYNAALRELQGQMSASKDELARLYPPK